MSKRNILEELLEGVAAMKSHREGKLTLRSYKVEPAPLPKVDSKLIRDTRRRLRIYEAWKRGFWASTKHGPIATGS